MDFIFGIFQLIIPIIVVFSIFSTIAKTQRTANNKQTRNLGEKQRTSLGADRRMKVGVDSQESLLNSINEHQKEFLGGAPMENKVGSNAQNYQRNYKYDPKAGKKDELQTIKEKQVIQRESDQKKKDMDAAKRDLRYAYDESYGKSSPSAKTAVKTPTLDLVREVKFRRKSLVEGMGNEFLNYGNQFLKAGDEYLNYKPGGLYGNTKQFDMAKMVMMDATKAKIEEKK